MTGDTGVNEMLKLENASEGVAGGVWNGDACEPVGSDEGFAKGELEGRLIPRADAIGDDAGVISPVKSSVEEADAGGFGRWYCWRGRPGACFSGMRTLSTRS